MTLSRYRRPARPGGRLWLQARDVDILRAIARHRYAQAEHVHVLLFAGRTLRVTQARLRKLWEHELLDRRFVPYTLDGERQPPPVASTPTYSLTARGAEIVAGADGAPPHLADRDNAAATLAHHVAVTDLLVALEAACRPEGSPALVETRHEWELWRQAKAGPSQPERLVVPDGAFTLRHPGRAAPETWYVELVRASVASGNETFKKKMLRYAELHRAGAFQRLFGDRHVRGVLVATPSAERARNLQALAVFVPGRRFFAFTHFEERGAARPTKRFRPDAVLALEWTDGAGEPLRLGTSRSASDAAS